MYTPGLSAITREAVDDLPIYTRLYHPHPFRVLLQRLLQRTGWTSVQILVSDRSKESIKDSCNTKAVGSKIASKYRFVKWYIWLGIIMVVPPSQAPGGGTRAVIGTYILHVYCLVTGRFVPAVHSSLWMFYCTFHVCATTMRGAWPMHHSASAS